MFFEIFQIFFWNCQNNCFWNFLNISNFKLNIKNFHHFFNVFFSSSVPRIGYTPAHRTRRWTIIPATASNPIRMTSTVLKIVLGCCERDSMRHRNQGFRDVAGCARIKMDSKRLKLNQDTALGRHNSLRYRTVGANAIIQLLEHFEGKQAHHQINIRNFGNPYHTCFGWMHWFCHARGLHTSAKCAPATVPALHEP